MKPHLEQARQYWKELLHPSDTVIDATCGNGKDTHFLASLVPQGHVFSIDIQPTALVRARETITAPHVTFLLQSHIFFPKLQQVRLVVYNLGYLPGGNHQLTTNALSTRKSLTLATTLLIPGGAISVTCYVGHPAGKEEKQAVMAWAAQLPSKEWDIFHHQWHGDSPSLMFVKKKEEMWIRKLKK